MVALLPRLMRRPTSVPVPLSALHNCVLCFGSGIMFFGTAVESYREIFARESVRWLYCLPPGTDIKGALYFWSYVYYLSKYYELLDTLLLICKGKRLSFLHVFHHATVVVMAYLWLDSGQSLQQVALMTNTAVHVVMYWYYLMCTLKRPPKWKRLITTLQIVQFCYSFLISIPFFTAHLGASRLEQQCSGFDAWLFNAAFNAVLLALFVNFHRNSYSDSKKSKTI